jgi:hypothetical protein
VERRGGEYHVAKGAVFGYISAWVWWG